MNVAEILRGIADKIDGAQHSQSAQLQPAQAQNDENPDVNTDSMVSPLQQKLELLKKAAGVDNAFDDGQIGGETGACTDCGCDPCGCEGGEEDPLSAMKRMAGLPVVVQMTGSDNDIEG